MGVRLIRAQLFRGYGNSVIDSLGSSSAESQKVVLRLGGGTELRAPPACDDINHAGRPVQKTLEPLVVKYGQGHAGCLSSTAAC